MITLLLLLILLALIGHLLVMPATHQDVLPILKIIAAVAVLGAIVLIVINL